MLYRTWGKCCVWCRRPIMYGSFEVDHLVPKSLTGEKLARALADYGLPASFDIYALPSLAPNCRPCNGSKGNRPVRGAPVVVAVPDKARQRAPKIEKRVTKFNRSITLNELAALFETIQPTADEMKRFNELVVPGQGLHPGANYCAPELPKLKRSKNKLSYDGFADDRRMLMMLEEWVVGRKGDALQVVEGMFDGGDTPPKHVWSTSVNFLAYPKEIGDFLANVMFTSTTYSSQKTSAAWPRASTTSTCGSPWTRPGGTSSMWSWTA
jgi:hypothetical protein